jgi:hypothetical protein
MSQGLRPLLIALLGVVAGLAAVVAAAVPAHACSCAQATDPEQLARADVVFNGRLLGRQDAPPAADGSFSSGDPAILTVAVARVYKGTARQGAGRPVTMAGGFWDVGAPGVAIAAGLVLVAGLLNLPLPPRDE